MHKQAIENLTWYFVIWRKFDCYGDQFLITLLAL